MVQAVSTAAPPFVNGVNVQYFSIVTVAGTCGLARNSFVFSAETRDGVATAVQMVSALVSVTVRTNAHAASGFFVCAEIESASISSFEPRCPLMLGSGAESHPNGTCGMYFAHHEPLRYIPSCCEVKYCSQLPDGTFGSGADLSLLTMSLKNWSAFVAAGSWIAGWRLGVRILPPPMNTNTS